MTAHLRLADYVRPGDTVVWGQACGEPLGLTQALVEQRESLGGVRCLIGIPATRTMGPQTDDHLSFVSYCATGLNAALHEAGALDILPYPYSQLPVAIASGDLRIDVVFVQVSPPDADGRFSLGLTSDYLPAAISRARVLIAEVNDDVPRTRGPVTLRREDFTVIVQADQAPAELPAAQAGEVVHEVAANVAALVQDEATLQIGLGTVPDAVLAHLDQHRGLGVHSGIVTDAVADLMERGVITNEHKTTARGASAAGMLIGTHRLFDFAHDNPHLEVHPATYTHHRDVLAAQHRFTAITSAIEVDLTGQVNAEVAGGRYVGAVGGSCDFLRGAQHSPGGLPVTALPSTAGRRTRIVDRLSGPVTVARSDAGVIVTEYGSADLRAASVETRIERMLQIAHPDHRDALARSAETSLSRGRSRGR